jgi:tripartite-type tricarboxylate transporter receptor subunit TctC
MKILTKLFFSIGILCAAGAAVAGEYPERPVRWIVPYSAGGGTDVLARTVANAMQEGLGQSIFIDNRPGGSTNIANQVLVSAKPDGYTVMSAENAALIFNEHLFKKLSFHPESDFSYIGPLGRFALALVVHRDFPAKTMNDLVQYAKSHPGKLNYASAGNGSPHHIGMERIKQATGIQIEHVPYRGSAPAIQDLIAGRVPVMLLDLASGLPYMRSGQIKVLAVGTAQRATALPDVPTFAEAGFKGMEIFGLQGVVAPANITPEVANKLGAELRKAMKQPNVLAKLAELGIEPLNLSGEEFKRLSREEAGRWGQVIRRANISLD